MAKDTEIEASSSIDRPQDHNIGDGLNPRKFLVKNKALFLCHHTTPPRPKCKEEGLPGQNLQHGAGAGTNPIQTSSSASDAWV